MEATPPRRHRKQASQKQLMAIALRQQGMSKTEALRKAGYKPSVQRNPSKVFTSQAITTAVDKFKLELQDQGLTSEYIAIKLKELLEASKLDRADYQIQLRALEMLKQILIDSEVKIDQPIKKTITLTEYLQPNTQDTNKLTDIDTIEDLVGIEANTIQPHISDNPQVTQDTQEKKQEDKTLEELII